MTTLEELVSRIAVALEKQVEIMNRPEELDTLAPILTEIRAQQTTLLEQNERSLKATAEWRETERKHMDVCELRYRRMERGEDASEPITH